MLSCVICQDGITEYENNNYPWVLSCGHVYHRKCFDQSQTNNCPKCRKIVTSSFRLYPDLLTRDESFTCLIECIQCAEGQLTRQKNVNEKYANYIKSLQDTLKEVEIKYTKLRMSIVRTVKVYHVRTNKLNADLETLQDHNKHLNEELNKSAERVSQHESTITDLQRKLQHEAGESRAMATRLNRKIQGLNREMGQMKSTAFNALRLTRVKEEEISRLESQGRELQANVIKLQPQRDHNEDTKKLSNEESKRRTESDPVVEELANCLDRVLLRKRKSLDEADGPPASEGEKASRIQQRSESGADSSQPSEYIHSLAGEASTSSGPAYTVTATREQENEASETQTVKCQYVRKTLKAVRRKKETH